MSIGELYDTAELYDTMELFDPESAEGEVANVTRLATEVLFNPVISTGTNVTRLSTEVLEVLSIDVDANVTRYACEAITSLGKTSRRPIDVDYTKL